jgi:hypothetical protein
MQATPHDALIAQIMDSRVPKNEREWAAAREIERLRDELRIARSIVETRWQEIERLRKQLGGQNE